MPRGVKGSGPLKTSTTKKATATGTGRAGATKQRGARASSGFGAMLQPNDVVERGGARWQYLGAARASGNRTQKRQIHGGEGGGEGEQQHQT